MPAQVVLDAVQHLLLPLRELAHDGLQRYFPFAIGPYHRYHVFPEVVDPTNLGLCQFRNPIFHGFILLVATA